MFNKQKTLEAANKIKEKLCKASNLGLRDSDIELKQDSNGSVEITILKGKLPSESHDPGFGATVKNISKVIDDDYYEFRRQGNTFTQPQGGSFTIGIKDTVNENSIFTFERFLKLDEMAHTSKFNSGWLKTKEARELVKQFKAGNETFELSNGDSYSAIKSVTPNKLEAGQVVFASYSSTNQGADIYEILGFSDTSKKYGDSGVVFKTAKEVLSHYEASSFKELNDKINADDSLEYGQNIYLVVRSLEDGTEGSWFYLYKGNFCRGSGAEKLTFTLVEKS